MTSAAQHGGAGKAGGGWRAQNSGTQMPPAAAAAALAAGAARSSAHLVQQAQRGEPGPVSHAKEQRRLVKHQQLHILGAACGREQGKGKKVIAARGRKGGRESRAEKLCCSLRHCRPALGRPSSVPAPYHQAPARTLYASSTNEHHCFSGGRQRSQLDEDEVLLLGEDDIYHPRLY